MQIISNHDQKALTLPSPAGRGEAVSTKCHLNWGEVVFEIKLAIA